MNPALEAIKEKEAEEWDDKNNQESDYYCSASFKAGFDSCHSHMQKADKTIENQELILKKLEEIRRRVFSYLY